MNLSRDCKCNQNYFKMFEGPPGAESISQVLIQSSCSVRNLDLRLNNKLGSEGIAFIAIAIARGCNLTA